MQKKKNLKEDLTSFKEKYFSSGFPISLPKISTTIGIYQEKIHQFDSKLYLLKIIRPEQNFVKPLEEFIHYLLIYLQCNTNQANYLYNIEAYAQEKNTFYILQKFHNQPLKPMEELQALLIFRGLTKLYKQLSEDQEINKLMVELNVMGPTKETVFFYSSSEFPKKTKLRRTKLKVDLLKFRETTWEHEVLPQKVHLKEIADLILAIISPENHKKLGICSGTILNRISDDACDWDKIFINPIFCQDKTVNPDLSYWKIEKGDRKYLKTKIKKEVFEEKKKENSFKNTSKINKILTKNEEILMSSKNVPKGPYDEWEILKKILKKFKDFEAKKNLDLKKNDELKMKKNDEYKAEIDTINILEGWIETTIQNFEEKHDGKYHASKKNPHIQSLIADFKKKKNGRTKKDFLEIAKILKNDVCNDEFEILVNIMEDLGVFK